MYLIKHTPGQRVSLSAIRGIKVFSSPFSHSVSISSGRQRRPINQAIEDSQGHESQTSFIPHFPTQPGRGEFPGAEGGGLSSVGDPGGASGAASPCIF